MPLCSCRATDISEGFLCNRSQKHIDLPTFQGSISDQQYGIDRKDLEKICSLEVAEIFLLFKKKAALNNFDKNFLKAKHRIYKQLQAMQPVRQAQGRN